MTGELRVVLWAIFVFVAIVYGPTYVQREFAHAIAQSGVMIVDGVTYTVTPSPVP